MRTIVALLAVFLCTAGTGCVTGRGHIGHKAACHACGGAGCQSCGILGGGGLAGHLAAHHCDPGIAAGPPSAQVVYPYYTVRGPRDFLLDDPPPLGP
jgi:hypothetical protein